LNAKYEWTVTGNNTVFLSEGVAWSVSHNGAITVKGETGNLSIAHLNFTGQVSKTNLPFYQQHSVAIATVVAVALVVIVAVLIKVKTKQKLVGSG
jgi:hypothetical protein